MTIDVNLSRNSSIPKSDFAHEPSGKPMIELSDVSVKFGSHTAVDRLNLTVNRGELFGFLGPNGAGKTTTIRVLTGQGPLTLGQASVAGHFLPRGFELIKPLIGYIPDTENHMEEFTGRENLSLFARLYDVPRSRIDEVLTQLELAEAADVVVRNYSKGMRKKLLIARELLHQPRVLFCDEPTANLDAHSVQRVRQLLREQASRGVTIFLTTHDMDEVEQICDRVAILCKGRLVECDTPTRFITRHAERNVAVQFERDDQIFRELLSLDDPTDQERLSQIVKGERCVRLHSQEFRFADVFLKLTGQTYS
ncbi:MAG: ABC transporter ATP-binding protein [Planctomycetota bacterium]|nr:ABC transporter ATP-binding protein [Planctomycetota bacterium]MDA1211683.1 ABC transporter ATP-binding protein [Planctomycetota bacterium]